MPRASRWRSAALVALALVATACPRSPAPGGGSEAPPPPPEGSVTVAYPWEPATLDPFTEAGRAPATRDLVRILMPGLTRDGEPWLLAAPAEPDRSPARSLRVRLRTDAVWSDGTPITTADLRATWRLAARRGIAPYGRIEAIERDTRHTATIRFTRATPRRVWRGMFAEGSGVLPAHRIDTQRRRERLAGRFAVSGGPFVLQRWRPGLDMTFTANPLAWERPSLARIRVVFVPDSGTAHELFRRGRVDVLAGYHTVEWERRTRELEDARVHTGIGTTHLALAWGSGLPERAVRDAFLLSVDTRRTAALTGEEVEVWGPHPAKLARARALLDRAGWRGTPIRSRGGVRLSLTLGIVGTDDMASVVSRALREQAARAGFDVQVAPFEPARFWSRFLPGSFDAALLLLREPAREDPDLVPLYTAVDLIAFRRTVAAPCPAFGPDGPFGAVHAWALEDAARC